MQMRWRMRAMRRGSVLGPLLLIGAGIVFLLIQTGRVDGHDFVASYGHWWPLLLVGAGLIVLAEWALDQFHMRDPERPQYRRSVGGGVIMLLLFLAFVGVLAEGGPGFVRQHINWAARGFHFDEDSMDALFGDKHEFDQTLDLEAPQGQALAIVNPRGDVMVSGTSDDGRVHIAVHKEIYARSDSDAESRAQQMVPKTSNDGAQTRISIHGMDGAHADLSVTVPPEAAITVNANRGDIHIASIKAAVTATANHGNVELDAISGAASVNINSGGSSLTARALGAGLAVRGHARDITLADITGPVMVNGDVFGATHMERVNGTVHFHTSRSDLQLARLDGDIEFNGGDISGSQVQGPFVLTTSNRNITLDRIAGDVSVTNRNGHVELTAAPALGNITIENRNGSIKTTLPEHAGMAVQATTTNGQIDTNLSFRSGGEVEQSSGNKSEKVLKGDVGPSSDVPSVHITTANGDISIMKGDVQPLMPPAPPAKITMTPVAPAKTPPAPKTPKVPKAAAAPATPNP
jgi:DUF4097 and DUF4098 domain-containing protein YvlB